MSKKAISTLAAAILFSASFNVFAQTTVKDGKPSDGKSHAPEIEFVKTVHDYGTIFQGGNGECEFEFKNVGKEPLVLSNVSSSCGCTVPSWPRDPVMPGKTAVIKVKYNTDRVGGINKTVTVSSNAEQNQTVVLRIQGHVKPKQEEALPEKQQSPMQTQP